MGTAAAVRWKSNAKHTPYIEGDDTAEGGRRSPWHCEAKHVGSPEMVQAKGVEARCCGRLLFASERDGVGWWSEQVSIKFLGGWSKGAVG
jgi:hypothetical protein